VTTAPPVPVCRTCGAPADFGQEYCLECGNRLLPPRRAPAIAAWVVPALVALVVAAIGAAAAIAATHDHTSRSSRAIVALSPLPPAPQPPPPAAAKPKKGKAAARLMAWPSSNGYTIVLASLPLTAGAASARAKAFAALRKGLRQVGVLVSSSYPSLQPGYYVVFSGVYPSLAEAQSSLDRAKESFPGAYARPIAR
jgi:septal ring-binding cell division protein DamX